jgi:hypothetical protein
VIRRVDSWDSASDLRPGSLVLSDYRRVRGQIGGGLVSRSAKSRGFSHLFCPLFAGAVGCGLGRVKETFLIFVDIIFSRMLVLRYRCFY